MIFSVHLHDHLVATGSDSRLGLFIINFSCMTLIVLTLRATVVLCLVLNHLVVVVQALVDSPKINLISISLARGGWLWVKCVIQPRGDEVIHHAELLPRLLICLRICC